MDESENYGGGSFKTYKEALAKCKQIVDEYLDSALEMEPYASAEQLFISFLMYGENPYIKEGSKGFNANRYAEESAKELVAKQPH